MKILGFLMVFASGMVQMMSIDMFGFHLFPSSMLEFFFDIAVIAIFLGGVYFVKDSEEMKTLEKDLESQRRDNDYWRRY